MLFSGCGGHKNFSRWGKIYHKWHPSSRLFFSVHYCRSNKEPCWIEMGRQMSWGSLLLPVYSRDWSRHPLQFFWELKEGDRAVYATVPLALREQHPQLPRHYYQVEADSSSLQLSFGESVGLSVVPRFQEWSDFCGRLVGYISRTAIIYWWRQAYAGK